MATDLTVVSGDYGYTLNFVVTNNGSVYDLTGATVNFKYKNGGSSVGTPRACTLDTPASGTCHYTILNTDFTVAGNYAWELEVTVNGKCLTYKGGNILVNEQI